MTERLSHKKKVSLVAPAYQEEQVIHRFVEQATIVLDSLPHYEWEIILVDDGSPDATLEAIRAMRRKDKRIKWISLSRNFGHQAALTAGLEHAGGIAVIMMDSDLQHPVRLIPDLLRRWEAGFPIVAAIRKDSPKLGMLKRLTSRGFYKILNMMSPVPVREAAADFRLMSRKALKDLLRMGELHRFIRGMVAWLGYPVAEVEYVAEERAGGNSKYSWRRMLLLALDGITSFSIAPLRLVTLLGLAMFVATIAYAAYAVIMRIINPPSLQSGWASLLISINLIGSAILLSLGVIGEYIGRIYEQVKGRPIYVIKEADGFDGALSREASYLPDDEEL